MYHLARLPTFQKPLFGSRVEPGEVDVEGGFFFFFFKSISLLEPQLCFQYLVNSFDWVLKYLCWTLYLSRLLTFLYLWSRIHHLNALHQTPHQISPAHKDIRDQGESYVQGDVLNRGNGLMRTCLWSRLGLHVGNGKAIISKGEWRMPEEYLDKK